MMFKSISQKKLERTWLLEAIEELLIPAFVRLGFESKSGFSKRQPVDRELISSLPFGVMRRRRDEGIHQVEIQLGANQSPEFTMNVGIVPKGGITSVRGPISAEDTLVTWLSEFFIVFANPRSEKPFSVSKKMWVLGATTSDDVRKMVLKVVTLVSEIDASFASGCGGPHMKKIRISR